MHLTLAGRFVQDNGETYVFFDMDRLVAKNPIKTIIPKIKRTNETLNVEVIRAFRKEIRLLKEALLFISLFFTKSMHLFMRERTSVNNYFDIIIPSLFFISESKRIVLAQILCKIKSISLNSLLLFTYFNKFYLNL